MMMALFLGAMTISPGSSWAALRHERFDREPADWEGTNFRNHHFPPRTVTQDFGYSPGTRHAGGQASGEVGGRIQPAGETAYYGWRLPRPLSLDDPMTAQGSMLVARGGGNFLIGFFNTNTLKEWRTPNSLVARINGRGDFFHCHFEYATQLWRAGAGVIGEMVPGERIIPIEIPSGQPCSWKLNYDPAGAQGHGVITFSLNGRTSHCEVSPEHRRDGAIFTHFGLFPVLKTWDNAGEAWIDDLTVNGVRFEFETDPGWEGTGHRRTYMTTDTRPRFDFGWSPTHYAGGAEAGELGGLIFRGDCREPERMACYGGRLSPLNLKTSLQASGKVCMLRGVTDSTASIGFYHSKWSMQSNPSQNQAVPRDYLGVNIEGPSSEGFFFYPVYRTAGEAAKTWSREAGAPLRIYPDGKVHDWFLRYDPTGASGRGRITVGLDNQTCVLYLDPGHKDLGADFDRFGICTPWIDGNSVTVYFDDLTYTASPE
jgi:hypothetical protein